MGRPEAGIAETPRFTVVVPVRDGGSAFARVLDALVRSGSAPREVVVVDDGSRHGSAAVARRPPGPEKRVEHAGEGGAAVPHRDDDGEERSLRYLRLRSSHSATRL